MAHFSRWISLSTHPMEQASHGGTAPNWLGAAQLKAGDSCPMRLRGSLPPTEMAPGARFLGHSDELKTGNCSFPVLFPHRMMTLKCPLQLCYRAGAQNMEGEL